MSLTKKAILIWKLIFIAKQANKNVRRHRQALFQSQTTAILRNKIKLLQMRLNPRNKKIGNVAELIDELRKKGHSNSVLEVALEEKFSGFLFEFIKRQYQNSKCDKKGRRYSDLVKQLSLTLHFYYFF